MNPYLTEDNKPTETLEYTLDYYGISLDEFKAMPDEQIVGMVKRFSDVLNDGIDKKSGSGNKSAKVHNWTHLKQPDNFTGGDSGSFSRYFDLDKWFEERIKQLPASVQKTFPFLIVPKASKSEKNKGCEGLKANIPPKLGMPNDPNYLSTDGCRRSGYRNAVINNHPCCKPIKLMSYLITLGSREGDIVLDPFMGSGTTALACQLLRRHYIGSEISKDYYEIAIRRLAQKGLI